MNEHKIGWLNKPGYKGETWNPIVGCSKVSAGCANCYAEKMACRLANMALADWSRKADADPHFAYIPECYQFPDNGLYAYPDVVEFDEHSLATGWNGETKLVRSALTNPQHWNKARMIFVCSMGDLFHENTPDEDIARVFAIIASCPQHVFVVLTKRAERMCEYVNGLTTTKGALRYVGLNTGDHRPERRTVAKMYRRGEVLPNLWMGVTVENQQAAEDRIPLLLKTPAAVRFVSCEPLIDQVDLMNIVINHNDVLNALTGEEDTDKTLMEYSSLDWVICGCESGAKRRAMIMPWADLLQKQCHAAGVSFFMKQSEFDGKVNSDIEKFPKNLRVREWPKYK